MGMRWSTTTRSLWASARSAFDADRGFALNGQHVKLNGVCLHHDGGCVGAAVPERVWERRLELLKQMGCNAIRTSHYPPAPEFLDLCDRMGFLVMDEAFDEWRQGKVLYGYHQYFDEWSEEDLLSMLRRDRNHPSIVLWSVGNEVPEQSRPEGAEILRQLIEIVRREDPTRPITSACDHMNSPTPTTLEFAGLLDVVGYNYVDRWGELEERYYEDDHHRFPARKMIGSENSSLGGIRGHYSLGGDQGWYPPYHSRMITPEQLWKFTRMHDYVAGDFMWTGIDYLGEARWPSKNASSGRDRPVRFPQGWLLFLPEPVDPVAGAAPAAALDLAGPRGPGHPGALLHQLRVGGAVRQRQIVRRQGLCLAAPGHAGARLEPPAGQVPLTTADLHLAWDVPYEPGTAAGGGPTGTVRWCATQEIATAGPAARLRLDVDRQEIVADGQDVAHVMVSILDGDRAPRADCR